MRLLSAIFFLLILSPSLPAQEKSKKGWWLTEPIALIQTNLREIDDNLDPKSLIASIKNFPANTLLFGFGGIVAHYPTKVEYHYPGTYLPAGKDLVGEVVQLAHASHIRVIGRFDFSRARKEVYDAHPEWFYRRKDGGAVYDDNNLYNACINGDYYNKKALEIMGEALERYDADGVFINWFGNLRNDYRGNPIGLCHCDNCERKFKALYGRSVPDEADAQYNTFIFQCAVEVARKFKQLIQAKRPNALFMTYIVESTDALVAEADLYKTRPLPLWNFVASDHVNSELNSSTGLPVFDLVMPYMELKYRFATMPGQILRTLLYQNIAHGAFPAFVVLGTLDQPDKTALKAVKPVFEWYEKNGKSLLNQRSAARVIVYGKSGVGGNRGSGNYRGIFRMLTELHIPFKVSDNLSGLHTKDIDLVIVPNDTVSTALQSYLEEGGAVINIGTKKSSLINSASVKLWENTTSAYMRIADSTLFPSLKDTRIVFCEGEYLELEPITSSPLTLIPPGQFGPPEKVSSLAEQTNKPGLVIQPVGKGKLAFIPWNIGDLYYKFSNDKHRLLIGDLVDHLLPNHQRQLVTNAHPAVEMVLMKQAAQKRSLLHLINMSGNVGNSYFEAIELRNVSVSVKGVYKKASLTNGIAIPVQLSGGYTRFVLPVIKEYEAVYLYE